MFPVRLAVLVTLCATSATVLCAPSIKLCTATADGTYQAVGEAIRRQVSPDRLRIELVETTGSMDNLKRMARGRCDAAIAQVDAYLVYQQEHLADPLIIARPSALYEEFVHLVCRRDSGVRSETDLLDAPEGNRVLVGETFSGSALTWRSIVLIKPAYARVWERESGGPGALRRVLGRRGATCLMFVSGLRSEFASSIDVHGDQLTLVDLHDEELLSAEIEGVRVYKLGEIPARTYDALQSKPVKTLTVMAILATSAAWAEANPDGWRDLQAAIQQARPDIRALTAPR